MKNLKYIEERVLLGCDGVNLNIDEQELLFVQYLEDGKFLKILTSTPLEHIFNERLQQNSLEHSIDIVLKTSVNSYLDQHESELEKQIELLCVGVASLQLFIQANWTGPPLEGIVPWLVQERDDVVSCLVLDGEGCCPTLQHAELLMLACTVLQDCAGRCTELQSSKWWLLRSIFLHQMVLDEFSPSLHDSIMRILHEPGQFEPLMENPYLHTLFHLEAARIYLYYTQVQKSKDHFTVALKAANMKLELAGALGRRTRFQQRDLSQLMLKVEVEKEESSQNELPQLKEHLPKDLKLDDEVRLNHIQFSSDNDGKFPLLTHVEQAVVLGMFVQTQKSQPKDNLAEEELLPYLECVLATPQCWSLQMAALLFRSQLESHHSRTVERAMMQVQSLVDDIQNEKPTARDRLHALYCSYLLPRWQVEAELATLLISLGAVNSALDIFQRLQMWEEVIGCYNVLKLRHKAAEVIEQELHKKESIKLWCLLGDATDDVSHYERAWELSGHKSGRAQRHWALFYFGRKQYAESIPHLRESLACNSLQASLWFRLGFAALEQEDWILCATAYRRYCSLDPENFEAWNNLAKAYVKTGQKARAWKALQEALKCNYENWRVWDNLMVVSTDCGEFEEVIRAYHRILDLKEKHVDIEVLKILATAVRQNVPDNQGVPTGRLIARVLELFGRLTSQVTNNAILWQLYAQLNASQSEQTPESLHKTTQYLQMAHRSAVQKFNWEKELTSCQEVMQMCISLAGAYLQCCQGWPAHDQALKMMSSAKLSLKAVITKVKQQYTDVASGEVPMDLATSLRHLEEKLEEIKGEMDRLQNSV